MTDEVDAQASFAFEGNWRDYAPIAFTNLLLTIVTLGVYRFWATTRTRRYLWSNTRFIDDWLEWTGTGKELFVGFLMVLVLIGLPFLFLQFGAQALVLQGQVALAGVLTIMAAFTIFYFTGVARFRALRYRLSRTWWHGIRGGSDDAGWGYGGQYMWRTMVAYLPFGLLIPWSMMSLWNRRMNRMSFGSEPFVARGRARPLMKRFLLFYLAPILFVLLAIAMADIYGGELGGGIRVTSSFPPILRIIAFLVIFLGVYTLLGLIALAYYAAFLREAIDNLSLGGLQFSFEASTDDWLALFFGDVALVVCTLGIGAIFLQYRHWKFFITHMGAAGEIYTDQLAQSRTRTDRHGEGLLDALDVGAF
ncbi:MAG: YjgN family protein [Pseudomonadota bacterium]|uniref:YjgN family protein n=1 Tax=Sphingobium sp. TaxID=1912891 RepID=UPI002E1DA9C0